MNWTEHWKDLLDAIENPEMSLLDQEKAIELMMNTLRMKRMGVEQQLEAAGLKDFTYG